MLSPLFSDLYQLNMMQAYLEHGLTEPASFEFFVRGLPARRGFLMAAGLEQALEFLETLRFPPEDLDWLARSGRFGKVLLDALAELTFEGDVEAMPEGTVFFPHEPILRVTSPLPIAQFVETRLINLLHFQSLIASKAARNVLAAPDKLLVDFGFRRAHGAEAGLMAARASYLAGFSGTATIEAGRRWDIPLYGTMAHAFVQAFDDEAEAFERFAEARPDGLVLLLDTYDTVAAARKAVALAPHLRAKGVRIAGVRLDSGDLVALSKSVRSILDDGGLEDTIIFASGGLDEDDLMAFASAGAPIDGYGVGTSLAASADAPTLDCVYKLVEYAGRPRRKRSTGKATWPGRKQVFRRLDEDGRMALDVLTLEGDRQPGEALLQPAMRGGRRVAPAPSLAEIRAHAADQLAKLPAPLARLGVGTTYSVEVAQPLARLSRDMDRADDERNRDP
ncbi:MAG TPA: nicotinate phosphoribosyltransferase [Caulobacteraceae bacterium]|nr:nicotinate phosphoribosyltransferase [Caulobacteraceae bacterium]